MLTRPMNITTEQIQQCLDENKQLIMTILEQQNLGKFAECALHQAQLQQNLMFLARIADIQPHVTTAMPSQMPPQLMVQQEHCMQPPQPQMSQQPKHLTSLQLNDQQQQQQPLSYHLQQQQFMQRQMNIRHTGNDRDANA